MDNTLGAHSNQAWEWNDEGWESTECVGAGDPWSSKETDGWLSDHQVRNFNVADINRMTAMNNGK